MGIKKQASKGGGGYVGGFLQLFDWNGKSRKKLFSNKFDLSEGSKQGKRSEGNLPTTWLHPIDDDLSGRSSVKERSDYSCASSVTDEEGNGTRSPGVVARLMGLDCLPTSDIAEPYCSPIYDCRSLRDSHYRRTPEIPYGNQIMHSGYLPTEHEGFSGKPFEMRPQKKMNRPIERFQTEILPPKSAKFISITHHKLLSPIKNPGSIPAKDAAQIMEEAAKIIEREYQASNKGKMPPLGSSSVPLKIRDLKEKIEATQRPSKHPEASRRPIRTNAVKYLKGQSLNKSWNGSDEAPQFRNSPCTDESSSAGSKSKGKSVSLAIQAKVNVQRREGLSSTGNRGFTGQKERHEFKSNKPFKSQMTAQKTMQKKPSSDRASGVLRQNNQKQNCQTNIEKLPSKPSVPNHQQQGRKPLSVDASFGRSKVSNKVAGTSKVGSRRTGLDTGDLEKDALLSKTKNLPRKKRSIERDFHSEKSAFSDTVLADKDQMPIQSNVALDGQLKWGDDNGGKGMDVVSFTFTSPLKKTFPGSQSFGQMVERNINFCVDSTKEKSPTDTKNTRLHFSGLNVIGGDALSILLEQKISELTFGVESSSRNSIKSQSSSTSAFCLRELVSDLNAVNKMSREDCNISQLGLLSDEFGSQCESNCSSIDWHKLQGVDEMGKYSSSSSNSETRKELDFPYPSPVSTLESSFSNESCISSDSGDSYNMNGGKQCLSVEAGQGVNSNCRKRLPSVEAETELSDSASFPFTRSVSSKQTITLGIMDHKKSEECELEYVREILCNAELMFKDFALGRAREIINPHLFDRLEKRKTRSRSFVEEEKNCRLRRKMLFDCVGECLDLRCRGYVGGGSRKWEKGLAMVRRKDWLADEVYKEITGWRNMEDWMLDEVVDKDMSNQYGRWLEFEIEEFEMGLEIERRILSSLVDEMVVDMLLV